MRSQQNICILCRRFLPTPPRPRGLRTSSSTSDTFDASKLLLDLLAPDNKHVRTYKSDQGSDEVDNSSLSSRQVTVQSSLQNVKLAGRPTFTRNLMRASPWRATGPDYFNLALLGDPFRNPSPFSWQLRQVFIMNMISNAESFEDQVKLLRATAKGGHDPGSGEHPSAPAYIKLSGARAVISRCNNLIELSRYLALLTNNQRRAKSLSKDSEFVVERIMKFRQEGRASVADILRFINALTQKLEGMDLGPGEALCDAGMFFAAKQLNLQALKRYIDIAWDRQYRCTAHRNNVAHVASRRALYASKDSAREGLLRLLTGWENNGTPTKNEERKPSLVTLHDTKYSPVLYASYLTALGTIGASDALWYEWIHQPLTRRPVKKSNLARHEARSRPDVFINAFLTAGALERALDVMKDPLRLGNAGGIGTPGHVKVDSRITDRAGKTDNLKEKLREAIFLNFGVQGAMEGVLTELERHLGLFWSMDINMQYQHYLIDDNTAPVQEIAGEEDLKVPLPL